MGLREKSSCEMNRYVPMPDSRDLYTRRSDHFIAPFKAIYKSGRKIAS